MPVGQESPVRWMRVWAEAGIVRVSITKNTNDLNILNFLRSYRMAQGRRLLLLQNNYSVVNTIGLYKCKYKTI